MMMSMTHHYKKLLLILLPLGLSLSPGLSAEVQAKPKASAQAGSAKSGAKTQPKASKGRAGSGRAQTITYTVKKGDTLDAIAKKHKTTTAQIQKWNRSLNPKALRIGQPLRLVVASSVAAARSDSEQRKATIARRGFVPGPTITQREAEVVAESPFGAAKLNKALPAQADPGFEPEPGFDVEASAPSTKLPLRVTLGDASPAEDEGDLGEHDHEHDLEDLPEDESDELALDEEPDEEDHEAQAPKQAKIIEHVVGPEENVGAIALKYLVDYEDIMAINHLKTLTPAPQTRLKIRLNPPAPKPKGPIQLSHKLERGESLAHVARRYKVSVDQIRQWNSRLNPKRVKVGQLVTLHVAARSGHAQSVGTPNRGRLYNGVPMETTPGIRVRSVALAHGTQRVVNLLKSAGADVKARWPETPHLVLGDISSKHGGRLKSHKSHQSGRDADVSFYHRGNVQLPDFRPMHEDNFDAAKNWHIFKTLIDTGEVQYIFVDYTLQRPLYEYARAIGYTEDELAPLLQYPRGLDASHGIIRHVRGHDDHWHIRFKCGPQGARCRD